MTIYIYNNIYKNNQGYNKYFIYKNYCIYNNIIEIDIYNNYKRISYKGSEYSECEYNCVKDIYIIYNKYKIYYKICNNKYIIKREYDIEYMPEEDLIEYSKYYIKNKILTNYKLFFII